MAAELIRDVFRRQAASRQPVLSFEFFPPRVAQGERMLLEHTIPALTRLRPDFCSVTYGAGGGTSEKTLAIVDLIQREHGLTALAHLTCVSATAHDLATTINEFQRRGIRNILALRGDPPGGSGNFQVKAGGFEFSWQLVQFIKQAGGFCVGTAGFPEGHIACVEGREVDWDRLKAKIDCGAEFVLTQLFFNNADFFRFRDYMQKRGVTVPICPGIIPILSVAQIKRFTTLCGASLPGSLLTDLDRYATNDPACASFGVEYATQQCADLLREGVAGLHFFTLNRATSATRIILNLGLRTI